MKSSAKLRQVVFRGVEGIGLGGLVSRSHWRSQRLLILCYHGFSRADEHHWNPTLFMTPDVFRHRIQLIRAGGYQVLPLAEAVTSLLAGQLPPKSVSITVDDGGKDFITSAYPVIQELGIPVTVYVSTYYVFDRRPVFDVGVSYFLWKGGQSRAKLPSQHWLAGSLDLSTKGAWQDASRKAYDFSRANRLSADEKHSLLKELARDLRLDFDAVMEDEFLHLMSSKDLTSLDPTLVDLQLHTHRHRVPKEDTLLQREIEDNRAALARIGFPQSRLSHFCYPSGVYRHAQLGVLRKLGIRSATTCVPGLAAVGDDPLLLPRFIDNALISEAGFKGWLSGIGAILRNLRH